MKRIALLLVLPLLMAPLLRAGQDPDKEQADIAVPPCDKQRALLLVHQQVSRSKAIDDTVSRITILIRAADALWPYQEEAARSVFTQAYEIAEKHFQESGYTSQKDNGIRIRMPDQRFIVISAVGRRDATWAKKLAKQAVKATKDETKKAASQADKLREASDLIWLATSLLSVDKEAAIGLFRSNLQHPGTEGLTNFLYRLAEIDRTLADSLYLEALGKYANATTREFLYLSAYPFGAGRPFGPDAQSMGFIVPQDFAASQRLQQLFLETFFSRSRKTASAATEPSGGAYNLPEAAQAYLALNDLEPLIRTEHPALLPNALETRAFLGTTVYSDVRLQVDNISRKRASAEANSFQNYLEKAERAASESQRHYFLTMALVNAPDDERPDRLLDLAHKISDVKLRQQLLNYLHFTATQKAIRSGLLDDAKRMAEKVSSLDQRAYLLYQIASESLKQHDDKQRAREVLDAVAAAAYKAFNTNEKARALLGVACLYVKFDQQRAVEVMSDAVKTINQIAEPNLLTTTIHQSIEGAAFSHHVFYQVEGFSLENTFRLLSPFDFTHVLDLATSLENHLLRSTSVIALSAYCLERVKAFERESLRRSEKSEEP